MALVSESFASLKGTLEALKEILESKGWEQNARRMNIAITIENTGKDTEDVYMFYLYVYIKNVGNNSVLWVHKVAIVSGGNWKRIANLNVSHMQISRQT